MALATCSRSRPERRESPLKLFPHRLLLLPVACLLLAGGACDDDADAPAGTPTAGATVAVPTPLPTGIITDGGVSSPSVGYEATAPAGWRVQFNNVTARGVRGDTYFKPGAATPDPARAQVNISVTCEIIEEAPEPVPQTVDEVLEQKVAILRQLRREDIRTGTNTPVDGREARQAEYVFRLAHVVPTPIAPTPALPESQIVIDRRDIFFLSDGCVWIVSLVAPRGELGADAATLEAFLASFRATR